MPKEFCADDARLRELKYARGMLSNLLEMTPDGDARDDLETAIKLIDDACRYVRRFQQGREIDGEATD